MRHSWSAYRQTKEHKKKREYINSLRGHIDEWLGEQELVYDLAKGLSTDVSRECWSRISTTDADFPFDAAGDAEEHRFFFFAGIVSELFTAEQMKLDDVRSCIQGRTPYIVLQLEKIYATAAPTSMHFFSDSVFERHVQSASANNIERNRYVVLADPAGHQKGHAMIACSSADQPNARKRALELTEKFDIRFMVARVDGVIDVH